MIFLLSATVLLHITVIGSIQHGAAQRRQFVRFRGELAMGTAPTAGRGENGRILPLGSPIAYLEIPKLDLREVVGEGTTGGVLMGGPGHARDSVLPGQFGTSVIMGRRAAFGASFGDVDALAAGDTIKVTTGQGVYEYRVVGLRREGGTIPAVPAGSARLTLVTAAGSAFVPNGVLRVDANLVGTPVVGLAPPVRSGQLPDRERPLGGDTSTLWVLVLCLQALLVLAVAAVWAWVRWGRAQTWLVFLPPLLLIGLATSGAVVRLLPNLM
jgi:LPXTG-site transpeptidase (sortase) family protein